MKSNRWVIEENQYLNPNQVNGGISPAPTYDANGNQTSAIPATLTWNALNQPITITATSTTSATYDALGRMVEKGVGGTYTQFVYNPDGTSLAVYSGSLTKGTISLPGGSTAVYNASGLNFIRHKDWLGSSRLATTWAHVVYAKEAYAPFGETYNELAANKDASFTGQDQNVVPGSLGNGVYDYLFRKYDPSAGRWLSPDPAGWGAVNVTDPQSLDRYAYVENQPMTLVDPTGQWWCFSGGVSTDSNPAVDPGQFCYSDGYGGSIIANPGSGITLDNGTIHAQTIDANGNPITVDAGSYWYMDQMNVSYNGGSQFSVSSYSIAPGPTPTVYTGTFYRYPLVAGTNYCGPGGYGPILTQVDNACFQHDACYDKAGASFINNVFHTGGSDMQASIASCNQQLCNSLSSLQTTSSQEMGQAFQVSLAFGCH